MCMVWSHFYVQLFLPCITVLGSAVIAAAVLSDIKFSPNVRQTVVGSPCVSAFFFFFYSDFPITTLLLPLPYLFYPYSQYYSLLFLLLLTLSRRRLQSTSSHSNILSVAFSLLHYLSGLLSCLVYAPVPSIRRRFWQDGDLLRKQSSYRSHPDSALISRGTHFHIPL